ncbi:hypothetical protein ACIPWY_31255 [Streptomyces sp. NPDC090032]|uniref:hypothetical protein n=1 Tax=Streptomyces sp. NPDC090032 TaxID=3365925 RepID=UPI003830F7DB
MVKHYRFAVQTPDQLWAMVESADGSTPADLGALLTSAAKTIKEIGDDLKTHSTAQPTPATDLDSRHIRRRRVLGDFIDRHREPAPDGRRDPV